MYTKKNIQISYTILINEVATGTANNLFTDNMIIAEILTLPFAIGLNIKPNYETYRWVNNDSNNEDIGFGLTSDLLYEGVTNLGDFRVAMQINKRVIELTFKDYPNKVILIKDYSSENRQQAIIQPSGSILNFSLQETDENVIKYIHEKIRKE